MVFCFSEWSIIRYSHYWFWCSSCSRCGQLTPFELTSALPLTSPHRYLSILEQSTHHVLSYNHLGISHSSRWLSALLLGYLYGGSVNVCPCVGLHVSPTMCVHILGCFGLSTSLFLVQPQKFLKRDHLLTLLWMRRQKLSKVVCCLAGNETRGKTPNPFSFSKTTGCSTQLVLASTNMFMIATDWVGGGEGGVCGIKGSNLLKLLSEQKRKI